MRRVLKHDSTVQSVGSCMPIGGREKRNTKTGMPSTSVSIYIKLASLGSGLSTRTACHHNSAVNSYYADHQCFLFNLTVAFCSTSCSANSKSNSVLACVLHPPVSMLCNSSAWQTSTLPTVLDPCDLMRCEAREARGAQLRSATRSCVLLLVLLMFFCMRREQGS